MSQFTTTIPIPLDAVLGKLPKGAVVHPTQGVQLSSDRKSVVLHWEHDDWRTPYSRPEELSVDQVAGKAPLPAFVKVTSASVAKSGARK